MSAIGASLAGTAMALGGMYTNRRNLMRKTPNQSSNINTRQDLLNSLESRIEKQGTTPIDDIYIIDTKQEDLDKGIGIFGGNSDKFANYGVGDGGAPLVNINPNADTALLAHELGHIEFGRSSLGESVQRIRKNLDTNPKLKRALQASLAITPLGVAALTPGDDDLAQSIAAAAILSSPTLIDEFEASRRGLGIMNNAGQRASLGQRGRLAGAYLNYLAAPIIAGAGGNITGNLIDDYIVE